MNNFNLEEIRKAIYSGRFVYDIVKVGEKRGYNFVEVTVTIKLLEDREYMTTFTAPANNPMLKKNKEIEYDFKMIKDLLIINWERRVEELKEREINRLGFFEVMK